MTNDIIKYAERNIRSTRTNWGPYTYWAKIQDFDGSYRLSLRVGENNSAVVSTKFIDALEDAISAADEALKTAPRGYKFEE